MPNSTSVARYPGPKEPPAIQFDDKPDATDIYAFVADVPSGASATAAVDPVLDGDTLDGGERNDALPVGTNNGTIRGWYSDDADAEKPQAEHDAPLDKFPEVFIRTVNRIDFEGDPADTFGAESDVLVRYVPPLPAGSAAGSDEDGPAVDGFPNGNRYDDDILTESALAIPTDLNFRLYKPYDPAMDGFRNGNRSDDDVLSESVLAILRDLNGGQYNSDDYADAGTEPLADNVDVFDQDDPEDLGDGEALL